MTLFYRWSPYTLASFPLSLRVLFAQDPAAVAEDVNGKTLMTIVEKHYRKLKSIFLFLFSYLFIFSCFYFIALLYFYFVLFSYLVLLFILIFYFYSFYFIYFSDLKLLYLN